MSYQTFSISPRLFDELSAKMQDYTGNAENVINEVLWGQGGKLIDEAIRLILPRSGRTWKGKAKAAADAMPFRQENYNLGVIVTTKYDYHYLYFPDDGSTTRKHAGNMGFMYKGAENSQDEIINLCIAKLTEDF